MNAINTDPQSLPYTIRTLANLDEYATFERLQAQVWKSGDLDVVPLALLVTIQKNGGLVAGAFDSNGAMVGLLTGFIGRRGDKFRHCSHIAGVIPELRRQNIGFQLKLFQREYVQQQGFDLITWTFDPLESVNANLNINKLGGIARTYSENNYGYWNDGLNAGLPTDRFEVEWWINTPRIADAIQAALGKNAKSDQRANYVDLMRQDTQQVLATRIDARGIVVPLDYELGLNVPIILLEVPSEYQQVKAISMDLAEEWRFKTRAIFKAYFSQGYTVTDLVTQRHGELRRNHYVLRRSVGEGVPEVTKDDVRD